MIITYAPMEDKFFTVKTGIVSPSFSTDSTSLSPTTSLVATIFFMLIGGAAFYRFAMAGIYRLEASENGIRKSNEAFKGATFGVLGVFLMFLIFFTVNRDLLSSNPSIDALKVPPATSGIGTPTNNTGTRGSSSGPLPTGACVNKSCTSADLPRITGENHANVKKVLLAAGITINRPNACTSIGEKLCTNVGGLPDEVITMLKNLKVACNCNVMVSGGTEWWSHSSHGPGVLAIDLRIPKLANGAPNPSDGLFSFINSQPISGTSGNCHSVHSWGGWKFCDEKDGVTALSTDRHWHVSK